MPASLAKPQRQLLDRTFRYFLENGAWPSARRMDLEIGRAESVQRIATDAGSHLVVCASPEDPNGRCFLTLRGVARCEHGKEEIDRMLAAIRYMAKRYVAGAGTATVSAEEFMAELGMTDAQARRAAVLLEQAHSLCNSRTLPMPPAWPTFTLDPFAARVGDVRSLQAYEGLREKFEASKRPAQSPRQARKIASPPHPAQAVFRTRGKAPRPKIFVVHGRDVGVKSEVARFLEKLGAEAVILHEQSDGGQTIIEKFETHASGADFGVVILTPDDLGGLATENPQLTTRARQNVIFEFGFFVGTLGRERVCALMRGNVETPSDIHGLIYIPMDESGAWQMRLVKELKAAKLELDFGAVL